MCLLILSAVLAALPAAYELDYSALPAANTAPAYKYTIVLSFPGEPDVKIPTTVGMKLGPAEAASGLMECLSEDRWKIKRDGERITIYGYDDVRIQKLTVEGNGPKPLVRRIILPPEKKK
jgi:hypothetical protein